LKFKLNFQKQTPQGDFKLIWTTYKTSKAHGCVTKFITDEKAISAFKSHLDNFPKNKFLFQHKDLANTNLGQIFKSFFEEKIKKSINPGDWRIIGHTHVCYHFLFYFLKI